ncbi:MAG: hypothetical protein ACUVUD_04450 [bacterium]
MAKRYDYTGKDVQEVYDGPAGLLWEAVMSEQIHFLVYGESGQYGRDAAHSHKVGRGFYIGQK